MCYDIFRMPKKTTKAKKKKPLGAVALKHRLVAEKLNENLLSGKGGGITQAKIDAGYSKSYAGSGSMKTTKSWQALMEEFIPDSLMAETHNALMKAKRVEYMVFPKAVTSKEIKKLLKDAGCPVKKLTKGDKVNHVWYWVSDNRAHKDALDMAYKLKGRYAAEQHEHKFKGKSDEELEEYLASEIARVIGADGGDQEKKDGESV